MREGIEISEMRRTLKARILAQMDRLVLHREGTPFEPGDREESDAVESGYRYERRMMRS